MRQLAGYKTDRYDRFLTIMADTECLVYLLTFLFLYVTEVQCTDTVVEYHEDRKPCPYFQQTRYPNYEPGLVNCTWYISSTCCKRTEVTSVFTKKMLPLDRASTDCHNRMNYLMCFFCSPDQYLWYKKGKVHVCESFCLSVYEACQDAYNNATRLGEVYHNGTSFCEAQDFEVVNSKYCFKFDPTVFGRGPGLFSCTGLLLMVLLGQYLLGKFAIRKNM